MENQKAGTQKLGACLNVETPGNAGECSAVRMTGRDPQKENDLFFTCSLIEYMARKTKNHRVDVVRSLGRDAIGKIYDLADVYHCENIDEVADSFIEQAKITEGSFDNVGSARYIVPSHWDIGKVYKRLILGIQKAEGVDVTEALWRAYESFVTEKIEDYNSAFYYDAPQNILGAYLYGEIE